MTRVGREGASEFSAFFADIAREREAQIELNKRFISLELGERIVAGPSVLETVIARRDYLVGKKRISGLDDEVSYVAALGTLLEEHEIGITDAVEIGSLWEVGYGRRLREMMGRQRALTGQPQANAV